MDSEPQSPLSLHESLDHDQDDDPAEKFQSVLSCLDKSRIVPLVRDARKAQDPAVNAADAVVGETKYGSFHVLFPVEFSDGQTWLVKIPMNGSYEQWNALSAAALTSEANTMRMLKRETTVPVPAVLDFSCTTDNVLWCPVVLRQLIEWLPEPQPEPLKAKPFVLAHPDFDIQNFLVSDDGELQAIIDWDGICSVPRSVGNQSLPGWLTRDWDPDMYGYVESMDQGEQPVGVWEDSPAELARYRGIYRGLMHACLGSVESDEHKIDSVSISVIAENLAIAAREPVCRHGILEKMVDEIAKITKGQFEMDILDLAVRMTDGELGEEMLEALRTGFLEMVEKASSL